MFLLPFLVAGYMILHSFYAVDYLKFDRVNLGFFGIYENTPLTIIISAALVFFNAIIVNNIFNRNEFKEKNTYLPALIFVVLASFSEAYYQLNGSVASSFLIALVIIQLYRLNQNEDGRKDIFNAAFLFGLSACFYPVIFFFFPILFLTVWVLRPFVLRESILMILGFTLPLIYAGILSYYAGYDLDNELFNSSGTIENKSLYTIAGSLLLILSLTAAAPLLMTIKKSGIRLKKLFRIIFFLIIAFGTIFLFEIFWTNNQGGFYLMTLPLSILLTYAFGERELRPFPTFIFYVIFMISVGKFFYAFKF